MPQPDANRYLLKHHLFYLFIFISSLNAQTASSVITNDFPGGYIARIDVVNNSAAALTSWLVFIELEGTLSSHPEADLVTESSSGNSYAFTNLDYNGSIPVGETRSFQIQVNPDNDTLPPPTGTVIPNWIAGTPALSISNATATEDAGSLDFTLTLNPAPSLTNVTVDYSTQNDSAQSGSDYTARSGTLTFLSGESTKSINIPIFDDSQEETEESFSILLTNILNADLLNTEATGTITDNDGSTIITKSYTSWLANHFSAEEIAANLLTLQTADPDTDSATNLLEYALGTDPRASNHSITELSRENINGSDMMALSYTQNREAEKITIKLVESDNLSEWTEVITTSNDSTIINGNQLAITKALPLDTLTPHFYRIEVEEDNSTGEGVLFSLDFEEETTGSLPADWQSFVNYVPNLSNSTDFIYVTDTFGRDSSSRSLKVEGSSNNPAQIVRKLPENQDRLYMRAWYYMSKSMGNDPDDNHEHIMGVKADQNGSFSADDEIRIGQGKGHLGFNHLPSDAISPEFNSWYSGPATPVNEWFCVDVEMVKNSNYHQLKMWVNGDLVNEVTSAADWHSTVPANWLDGKMGFVFFGWHSFSQNAVDMWIDDITVSTEPLLVK